MKRLLAFFGYVPLDDAEKIYDGLIALEDFVMKQGMLSLEGLTQFLMQPRLRSSRISNAHSAAQRIGAVPLFTQNMEK